MNEFISRTKKILVMPVEFFSSAEAQEGGKTRAFRYMACSFLFATILSYLMNVAIPFGGLITINNMGKQPGPAVLLISHVVFYFFGLLVMFGNAGLWYLSILIPSVLLKVNLNYTKLYQILIYALVPAFLLGSFPYIKTAAFIWSFVLAIIGFKCFYNVSYTKASIIIVVPVVLYIAISTILLYSFLHLFHGLAS